MIPPPHFTINIIRGRCIIGSMGVFFFRIQLWAVFFKNTTMGFIHYIYLFSVCTCIMVVYVKRTALGECSLNHVCSGDQTQARLGSKLLYLLSHFSSLAFSRQKCETDLWWLPCLKTLSSTFRMTLVYCCFGETR